MHRSSLIHFMIVAIFCGITGSALSAATLVTDEPKQDPAKPADSTKPPEPPPEPEPPKPTGLAPARLLPGIGAVNHSVTTSSVECQQFYSQGLAFQHSFVYMEAVRSFERATQLDPKCPMAFWGLSRALDMWGRGDEAKKSLAWAKQLSGNASYREQKLIEARVLEKDAGSLKDKDREDKMNQSRRALDEVLALYPEDEEAWMQRA